MSCLKRKGNFFNREYNVLCHWEKMNFKYSFAPNEHQNLLSELTDNTVQPLSLGSGGFGTAVCCHLPVSSGNTRFSAGRPSCRMCVLWEKFLREYRKILSSL